MSLRRDQPTLTLIGAVLDLIEAYSGSDDLGTVGADLDTAIGNLRVDAPSLLRPCGLFGPLGDCFDLARRTGMTFDGMERLRLAILALAPGDARAAFVQARAGTFAAVHEARITAATTFGSRTEVDRVLGILIGAFAVAQQAAADVGDAAGYRALVALRAAAVRDLTSRSRPLPRLVAYNFGRVRSAITLAQRLYGDAGRADELTAENQTIHPLFTPRTGRALSA